MPYINRHAEKTIIRLASEFPAVLVTGARQAGKTTLLKKVTDASGVAYLSFDDPMEEFSAKNDPKTFLEFNPSPQLFDEIQYVPELFRYLKLCIDADRKNGMYYLTGSQQFTLIEKASESLAGRIGILQLYPLSAREIRSDSFDAPFIPEKEYIKERAESLKGNVHSIEKTWKLIHQGGYPEVNKGTVSVNDFYANYLKTYIERDIRKLVHVTDELQFLQFIAVAASRTGQMVNYGDMARDIGISEVTAKKWLSLLVTSGLVYLLHPYSANVEKRIVKTPKLYFIDTGLAAYLTRWTNPEVMMNGAMAGAFFETYVVGEIVKSFSNAGLEPPLYYYRDKDKIEIDLLIQHNDTLFPVEIKKTASPTQEDARNMFITGRIKNIQIGQKIVVCNCEKPFVLNDEVMAVPVEFL